MELLRGRDVSLSCTGPTLLTGNEERTVEVVDEPLSSLVSHAGTPIAFTVESVFDVHERPDGSFELVERPIDVPYAKDYDAIEPPAQWAERFDLRRWGLLGAHRDGIRVGGAVIAFDTPGVDMLEGRSDLAVLWDLRVAPGARRLGVGHALFAAGEEWARARGCTELKVETQNTNLPACRFYAAEGCDLREVNRGAYAALPEEIQLLWCKRLR